ncbi:MAG: hypothetical protein FJ275_02995 [Planctomycetes bacterium]|nr:hypothetical protein [Planctomycetota bacterium]
MALREESFKLDSDPAPLVVFDFMVAAWGVFGYLQSIEHLYTEEMLQKITKALWAIKVNRGPDMLPRHGYNVVVVSDKRYEAHGTYWRGVEINKDERMEIVWEEYCEGKGTDVSTVATGYKGNRREKDDNFYQVVETGWEYCQRYFPCFKEEGLEADDWAGAIFRISRDTRGVCHDRQVLLSTIDRDWSMLVDESHRVYWANTRIPGPKERIQERLAGEDQVLLHTEMKLGVKIKHPRFLAHAKQEQGDLGDNLPPGSPLEYFDLCEPHPKYRVEALEDYPKLVEAVNDPAPNVMHEHMDKALAAFRKIGLEPPPYSFC